MCVSGFFIVLRNTEKHNTERTAGRVETDERPDGSLERQTARIGRGKRGRPCLVHVNTRLTIARDVREHDYRVHQRALRT